MKNKVAPPFREAEFDIMYGEGIIQGGRPPRPRLRTTNIVEKSGAWFCFDGERIGQGREHAKKFLREHPEVLQKIEGLVLEKFGIHRAPVAVPAPEEPAEEGKRGKVKAIR